MRSYRKHASVTKTILIKLTLGKKQSAGKRIRTSEPTKGAALEAAAFDHFAIPALIKTNKLKF